LLIGLSNLFIVVKFPELFPFVSGSVFTFLIAQRFHQVVKKSPNYSVE